MSISLSITNRTRGAVDVNWLGRELRRGLKMLGAVRGGWTVTVVGDRAMAALHDRTMKLKTTTDVLTFDLRETPDADASIDLDTVLCVDEARRRAKEMGHSVREELLLYAIHSLLHVRGYNDVTAPGAAAMHRREDEILLALGVGTVYAGKAKTRVSKSGGRVHGRTNGKFGPRKKAS
jgi:probable rRNA maturation factor